MKDRLTNEAFCLLRLKIRANLLAKFAKNDAKDDEHGSKNLPYTKYLACKKVAN